MARRTVTRRLRLHRLGLRRRLHRGRETHGDPGDGRRRSGGGDDCRMLTLADRFTPGSPEFASLRARSSSIADSPIGLIRALAEVLKNLVLSVLMLVLVAVIFGWVFGWFVARLPLAASCRARRTPPELVHLPALDDHVIVATPRSRYRSSARWPSVASPCPASTPPRGGRSPWSKTN